MASFPAQPEELTSEWLTAMLASAGRLGDTQKVCAFAVQPIGDGVGMVGSVVRVELTYGDRAPAPGPATLVMKFAHPVAANRAIGMAQRVYEREVTFYNEIAPWVAVPKPYCYLAAVDMATGESIIVLEDLHHYRAGDQVAGIGADDARLVIDAVAPLHAAFWDNTHQPFLRAAMRVDTTFVEPYVQSVEGTWEKCLERFGYCVPAEIQSAMPAYVGGLRRLHMLLGDRPQTLLHGDIRMDNLMFSDGAQDEPVVLVDWQALMISTPLHDLALLLSMSATTELRRLLEEDLIRYYHAKVVELGVQGYALEQCLEDYDLAALWMMSVALIMGGAFEPANERGRRLAEAVLRRACATVLDRELLDRIPRPASHAADQAGP